MQVPIFFIANACRGHLREIKAPAGSALAGKVFTIDILQPTRSHVQFLLVSVFRDGYFTIDGKNIGISRQFCPELLEN